MTYSSGLSTLLFGSGIGIKGKGSDTGVARLLNQLALGIVGGDAAVGILGGGDGVADLVLARFGSHGGKRFGVNGVLSTSRQNQLAHAGRRRGIQGLLILQWQTGLSRGLVRSCRKQSQRRGVREGELSMGTAQLELAGGAHKIIFWTLCLPTQVALVQKKMTLA